MTLDLAAALDLAHRTQVQLHLRPDGTVGFVAPPGTDATLDALRLHREAIRWQLHTQARRCARCPGPYALPAYWGEPLCRPCAHAAAAEHDHANTWPPGGVE
jgi:hypothetical protein